jgi:hypothetical protein
MIHVESSDLPSTLAMVTEFRFGSGLGHWLREKNNAIQLAMSTIQGGRR